MKRGPVLGIVALIAMLMPAIPRAQTPDSRGGLVSLPGLGAPRTPKVIVPWDRYYDHAAIGEIGRRIAQAYPKRCKLGSIGKSYGGRELWLLTVTNFDRGDVERKPAMWIDGNIHSNEVQGTEISLYTAWYLCEMAGQVPAIDSLLDERVFYIVPSINPDGREDFLKNPNNQHSPRSGVAPRDNDGDGLVNEDGFDDLDGDGNITQMRRRNPNGRWKLSPEDPRIMFQARPDEPGDYELLGNEGIDNDGDGLVNEDGVGFYDPNRDWPYRWQPSYVQFGAEPYPTSLPETQAIVRFVLDHPNIAGAQTYHNFGGMILRGPGMKEDRVAPADVAVYDQIGKTGEQALPGYHYYIVWKDLYTVWGGELDWFYGGRGVIAFSNEVWTNYTYFQKEPPTGNRYDDPQHQFDRLLLFEEAYVPWKRVRHPQYGDIEVGGVKKAYSRAVPGFLLQSEAHRNMAFTLYHAMQLPLLRVDSITTRPLGEGLTEVTAIVANKRVIPTHTAQDLMNKITRPDFVSIEGGEALAGFVVSNPLQDLAVEQKRRPARLEVANVPSMGAVTVRWIVRGNGPFTIAVDSVKGGKHRRTGR